MAFHYSRKNQSALLQTGLDLTSSLGWRKDAIAFGVFGPEGDDDLRAVAVFQNFDAYGGEFHFGMVPGCHITLEIMQVMAVLAFHPMAMNLQSVVAHILEDNVPAQLAALKCGFSFEYRKRSGVEGGKDAIMMMKKRVTALPATAKPHDQNAEPAHEVVDYGR